MLVPQWEVFLAWLVEYGLIAWMTISILVSLRRRYNESETFRARFKYPVAIYLSLRNRVNIDTEKFKNPVKKLKDAPRFFNVKLARDEEPEQEIVAREEGSSKTAGLDNSSVVTEKPEKTAEIVEGGKPNLDSTPSKPSQLPASTTAQVQSPRLPTQLLPTKSAKLRKLEQRKRKDE